MISAIVLFAQQIFWHVFNARQILLFTIQHLVGAIFFCLLIHKLALHQVFLWEYQQYFFFFQALNLLKYPKLSFSYQIVFSLLDQLLLCKQTYLPTYIIISIATNKYSTFKFQEFLIEFKSYFNHSVYLFNKYSQLKDLLNMEFKIIHSLLY